MHHLVQIVASSCPTQSSVLKIVSWLCLLWHKSVHERKVWISAANEEVVELCLGAPRLNSVPRHPLCNNFLLASVNGFCVLKQKYLIKKELKIFPSLITSGLPGKMISLTFFLLLPLLPWLEKLSDISREKGGVYILSWSSSNIESESLSCPPNYFMYKCFVMMSFSNHWLKTLTCLRPEGKSHQPILSSKHQMCDMLI